MYKRNGMTKISFDLNPEEHMALMDRLAVANSKTVAPVTRAELIRASLEFSYDFPIKEVIKP